MKKYIFLLLVLSLSLVGCFESVGDNTEGFKFEKFEVFNKTTTSIRYSQGDEVNFKFTFNIPKNKNISVEEFGLENYGLFEFKEGNVFEQNGKTIAMYKFLLREEYGEVEFKVNEFYYMNEASIKERFVAGITTDNSAVSIEVQRKEINAIGPNNILFGNTDKVINLSQIEFENAGDISISKYMVDDAQYVIAEDAIVNFSTLITVDDLTLEEWASLKLFYEIYPEEYAFVQINLFNQEIVMLDEDKKIIHLEITDNQINNDLLATLEIGLADVYITNGSIFVVSDESDVKDYSITYHLDGGQIYETVFITYTIKDVISLPSPIKPGYIFAGWVGGTFTQATLDAVLSHEAGDKEYTAIWEAEEYVIYFHPEGGVIPHQIQTVVYGESFVLVPAVREGYTFLGWFLGSVEIKDGIWTRYSGLSLSAKWE